MEPRNQNICIYIIFIYIGSFYCQESSSTEEPGTNSTQAPIIVTYDAEKEINFLYYLYGLIAANLLATFFVTLVSTWTIPKIIRCARRPKKEKTMETQYEYSPYMRNKQITKINETPMKTEPESKDNPEEKEKAKLVKTEDEGEKPEQEKIKVEAVLMSEEPKKKSAEKEYQYQNNGPIKFMTQNAVASDLILEAKATPENKSIKQVKWAPEPFVFYEIGPGVDQIEMNEKIPSSASDIMTASLKQLQPKVK